MIARAVLWTFAAFLVGVALVSIATSTPDADRREMFYQFRIGQ